MSQKSEDETPIETPEQQYINFIKDRLEKHGILNLQNLTGHLSSVPARVRNKFGTSKSCLKKFIKEHPDSFKLDRRENVEIATNDKYNRLDSISSDEGVSIQKLIDEAATMDTKSKINLSPGVLNVNDTGSIEIPHPRDDLPFELKEMKGKVYRIFQVYGFITVKNPRLQASVYFDLQSFENGKLESFTDGHLKIGEGVYLNARKGPDNCEAQYRASLVWRPESTEYFQVFSNGSQESDAKEIRGCGKIHNLFPKYGFIARNTLVRDNVFFHLNNVVIPNEKEVNSLLDVFKIGDFVKFQAVPSEQKDSAIKWQASHVWLDHSATKDGNEIFMSDSESYDSASDRNDDDGDYAEGVDSKNNSLDSENSLLSSKRPQIGINSQSSSAVSSLSPVALPFYSSSVLASQINGDVSKSVTNQIGIIAAKTKDMAVIIFGERYMHRSITSLDVMYINCVKIKDFLLELGENARVHFDAIYQANGLYECNWKTTLVWIGKKPELTVKRQAPTGANHVEAALPSSTSLSTTDWASVVEMEQRHLESSNSQSSEVSSTDPLFLPHQLESSKSQHDLLDKPKATSPSTCSLFPQESKTLQINQPISYGTQSRFASHFSFANQGDTETSRISSQTFPMGMFSMSATPSGLVNSYPHYQTKASLHSTHPPHNSSSYMNPHFLQSLHNPTNNTVNYTNASEHSLLASSYSPSTSTGNFSNPSHNPSSISPPSQNAILEKKVQDLMRQVETLMKQQDSSNISNENDRFNSRPKCYKEMATQTDDYPSNERFSRPSNKITSTKHVQTFSTGRVMFSELYLDS